MNIANVLTAVRLVLVPAYVLCMTAGGSSGWRVAALAIFVVASVTDLLDGRLARSRGLVTDFGKIADPLADKALTGAALITLSALGELAWWVTVVILVRELGVTFLRFWVIRLGVIAASPGGKLKTMLQMAAICLYTLPASLSPPGYVRDSVMGLAVAVTVLTGGDYVVRALRLRGARGSAGRSAGAGPDGGPGGSVGDGSDSGPGGSAGDGSDSGPVGGPDSSGSGGGRR